MKNTYFSKIAQTIEPYQWEEGITEQMLRFDANTLPFPPKSVERFLNAMAKRCPINEYADPTYATLKKLIADYEQTDVSMITITNSGDEALDIIAKTFINPQDKFIVQPPTYEMFSIQCEMNGGKQIEVPLIPKTFAMDVNTLIETSKNVTAKLIFICNPNNPTGTTYPQAEIERILTESNCIVVVDEVYREFYGKSVVQLLTKYDNLVILRSFSKFAAMAGARIGYLISNPTINNKFDGIRLPMGVSYLSYKLAEYVLQFDKNWIVKQVQMIIRERERLTYELTKLGCITYPSQANFLLVDLGGRAQEICNKLRDNNILIRDRSTKKYLEGCVRITVRSPEENTKLIANLKQIL
ncbi:histidinol-phosphate transaminase [Candidatus Roizmanbacteria bacterium CG_4_10_14_0_2_um_filter_36_9]|uniref:Histidinol-phosphate transaminase n=1 Tax=Candidatus Roizmanbacteria bacterium CG_4_10_14_0_2_um_filter_36_9 TaxID=1974823 RepID=A0A2M7U2D7_9BACT|nr:MAG: histidinol-phosphate transaminase [Candidatus Roizmanbacteria bacterium CG_4_10_14_0_2_um_filter_36_9]